MNFRVPCTRYKCPGGVLTLGPLPVAPTTTTTTTTDLFYDTIYETERVENDQAAAAADQYENQDVATKSKIFHRIFKSSLF